MTKNFHIFCLKLFTLLRLLRISQYTKNIFVFLPLFFSGLFLEFILFINACIMFIAFCCAASFIYIINDILDRNEDKNHPTKSKRPIASEEISIFTAKWIACLLLLCSFLIAWSLSLSCLYVIFLYILLNIFYVFFGKNYGIIDITCIALGFVLRTIGGAFAISQNLSHWLTLMVFLLCMFLALGKRWDDVCLEKNEKTTGNIRTSIKAYSQTFIVATMTFLSTI